MRLLTLIAFLLMATYANAQFASFYLLVGTYTTGKSEGIYVYKFDAQTGEVNLVSSVKVDNPSYLAISSNEKFVYSVNEKGGNRLGKTTAFAFDKQTGVLSLLNQQPIGGNDPCYLAVDKANKWLFTANYSSGSITVLPLTKSGAIDTLTQVLQHTGSSVNAQRQKEPHAHTFVFSPDEKRVFTTDLGTDKINQYRFNTASASTPLVTTNDSIIYSKPGNGPRHIAFHPSQKIMCVINELSGTIDVFNYAKMKPQLLQTVSTDTSNRADKGSADIHFSPDGKFLYATNRGNDNNIAIYAVNSQSKSNILRLIGLQPTLGKTPRNFIIDPTGNFLLVANQKSDNIIVFKRNTLTGLLTPNGKTIEVGNPSCLKMMGVK